MILLLKCLKIISSFITTMINYDTLLDYVVLKRVNTLNYGFDFLNRKSPNISSIRKLENKIINQSHFLN